MDNVIRVVQEAEDALGTVTILVNNAGIPDAKRAHKMDQQLIDAVFDTNLRGPYVLSCEVARRLIAAKDRKSTRLNSSHVVISYAVFCLKKKKKLKKQTQVNNRTLSLADT